MRYYAIRHPNGSYWASGFGDSNELLSYFLYTNKGLAIEDAKRVDGVVEMYELVKKEPEDLASVLEKEDLEDVSDVFDQIKKDVREIEVEYMEGRIVIDLLGTGGVIMKVSEEKAPLLASWARENGYYREAYNRYLNRLEDEKKILAQKFGVQR